MLPQSAFAKMLARRGASLCIVCILLLLGSAAGPTNSAPAGGTLTNAAPTSGARAKRSPTAVCATRASRSSPIARFRGWDAARFATLPRELSDGPGLSITIGCWSARRAEFTFGSSRAEKLVGSIPLPRGMSVEGCCLAPDEKSLAVLLGDKAVLFDLGERKKLRELGSDVQSLLGWTPNGKRLLFTSEKAVEIRDVDTWSKAERFPSGGGACYCALTDTLAVHEEGAANAALVRGTTGKRLGEVPLPEPRFRLDRFSPDGKLLVMSHADKHEWTRIHSVVFDSSTGAACGRFKARAGPLLFSPDGKLLVSASGHVYDVAQGKEARQLPRDVLCFSRDAKTAIAQLDNRLAALDVATRRMKGVPLVVGVPEVELHDGKQLLTRGWDGEYDVLLWQTATGRLLARHDGDGFISGVGGFPDGRIALLTMAGKLIFWDPTGGKKGTVISFPFVEDSQGLCISADGSRVAVGDGEAVLVYDVASSKLIAKIKLANFAPGGAFALSTRGDILATNGAILDSVRHWAIKRAVVLIDVDRGRELWRTTCDEEDEIWPWKFLCGDDVLPIYHCRILQGQQLLGLFEIATGKQAVEVPLPNENATPMQDDQLATWVSTANRTVISWNRNLAWSPRGSEDAITCRCQVNWLASRHSRFATILPDRTLAIRELARPIPRLRIAPLHIASGELPALWERLKGDAPAAALRRSDWPRPAMRLPTSFERVGPGRQLM